MNAEVAPQEAASQDGRDGSTGAASTRKTSPWLRVGILVATLLLAVMLYVRFYLMPHATKPIPVLGHVPAFRLTDQSGAAFTDADMRGNVWIADFIFTSCSATCPKLTEKMKRLQGLVAAESTKRGAQMRVRLVSFSVDPETDTPPVLATYAAKIPADPKVWSFVTGPADDVRGAITSGFKMTAERIETGAGEYDVLHGNWFVLGDRAGNIRGYYEAKTDNDVDVIARDVMRLDGEALP